MRSFLHHSRANPARAAARRETLRASDIVLAMLLTLVVILGVVSAVETLFSASSAPSFGAGAAILRDPS